MNADHSLLFNQLLSRWEREYGSAAVHPLISIAKDTRNSDRTRYIAVMGAAKLGGQAAAPLITPLLKDKIWLIRSASLRALGALKNPRTSKQVLPLLKDPALVVRLEAIEAVRELHPAGASRALVQALESQENYHYGKSQWVPLRALQALSDLQDKAIVPELKPLLDHGKDPELQKQTIQTLEALTGRKTRVDLTLAQKIADWKKALND